MADSSPPMVVGIRHTSSATSTVTLIGVPLQAENGQIVAVANRNTMVKATSSMVRAISFVFYDAVRLQPWRSSGRGKFPLGVNALQRTDQPVGENACPAGHRREVAAGFADHRCRFAGDGAFINGMHRLHITSPSQGIMSPASTSTTSPLRQFIGWDVIHLRTVACFAQFAGKCRLFHPAQAVGLRFAAAFRHRFGKVGK
ncbi:Uncharacterised protein [Kluyvera cryocrescens]|uniref:Uncharacterized protein n=1 Tax=Kluyvera cryocrescens TaxID=580 RepID=A0A485CLE4_KLUCR|nr:Uncharacterised protein [Kluyvera cryocrescens]